MDDDGFSIHITPPDGFKVSRRDDMAKDSNSKNGSLKTVSIVATIIGGCIILFGFIQSNFFYSAKDGAVLADRVQRQSEDIKEIKDMVKSILQNQAMLAKRNKVKMDISAASALNMDEIDLGSVNIEP